MAGYMAMRSVLQWLSQMFRRSGRVEPASPRVEDRCSWRSCFWGGAATVLAALTLQAGEPPRGKASDQIYQVRWLPSARVKLGGRADEAAWKEAVVEKRFVFPWKQSPAPETEFRALCDGTDRL